MNGVTIVKEEAEKVGVVVTDALIEYLLWEETGWPSFFQGDPETCLREQVQKALIPVLENQKKRERAELQKALPTRWERLGNE